MNEIGQNSRSQSYISQNIYHVLVLFISLFLTNIIYHRIFKKKHLKLISQSYVVVTGGCMGIGYQMVKQIAKMYHCTILIVDIRRDLFQIQKKQVQITGAICKHYYCDLANDFSVKEFIQYLLQNKQKIDLFIHNAGIVIPKTALETTNQQFMLQFKVNFLSPVKIMRQTISLMQNGHIGVVASMAALTHGGVNVSTYSSSKYALYSFVNCFRQELKVSKSLTTISMGCPYLIRTGMFEGFRTKLDFIFVGLSPQYVGRKLVRQFIQKKEICYIHLYEAFLFKMVAFLPTQLLDILSIQFNVSNFHNIRQKHTIRISNIQNKYE